jgi:hypothetical protein
MTDIAFISYNLLRIIFVETLDLFYRLYGKIVAAYPMITLTFKTMLYNDYIDKTFCVTGSGYESEL